MERRKKKIESEEVFVNSDPTYKDIFVDWLLDPKSDDDVDLFDYEKIEILEAVLEVMLNWAEVAKDMSHRVQEVVLWRIIGNPLFMGWYLDDKEIPLEKKLELLEGGKAVTLSIPILVPTEEPLGGGYYMLWGCFAPDAKDPEVADECLRILTELVLHRDEGVQIAAMHGLGHLQHPDRPAAVDLWIQFHPEAKDNEWVLQCRNGTVM